MNIEGLTVTNISEVGSVIVSMIAAIISLWAIYEAKKTSDKSDKISIALSNKTLAQRFFEEIFFEEIVFKLPKLLAEIEENGLNLVRARNMKKIINSMFKKMIFYKYFEPTFYEKVSQTLIQLDTLLVSSIATPLDSVSKERYKREITTTVEVLYTQLKSNYLFQNSNI